MKNEAILWRPPPLVVAAVIVVDDSSDVRHRQTDIFESEARRARMVFVSE